MFHQKARRTIAPSSMKLQSTTLGSGIAWEQLVLPFYCHGVLLNFCNQAPIALKNQILCIHDLTRVLAPQSYSRAFRLFYGATQPILARRAARIVTVSEFSAQTLADYGYCPAGGAVVIPNGHEHVHRWNADSSTLDLSHRPRRYVFALGSQAKHKNIEVLYSIAQPLEKLGIDVLIAGGTAAPSSPKRMFARMPPTFITSALCPTMTWRRCTNTRYASFFLR